MTITAPARAISVGLVAIITIPGFAQTPTAAPFEVASVKAADPKSPAASFPLLRPRPGQLTVTSMTLRGLVQNAYAVEEFQVIATDGWQSSERYDVVGKAPDPRATLEDMLPMLRTLLAERFNVSIHTEKRQLPIAVLARARPDRLGPNLKPTVADCASPSASTPRCGVAPFGANGAFGLRGTGQPMAVLTRLLSQAMERQVQDRTGLTGLYDFEFSFDAQILARGAAATGTTGPSASSAGAPQLETAVSEQLGLKLDLQRGDVDVVVIDRAERPSAD